MGILIQPIGKIKRKVLLTLQESLEEVFNLKCFLSSDALKIPEESYNPARDQYYSTKILLFLKSSIKKDFDRVIGVTNVDLYVPWLNFVFGEAECPGKFALISLYKLRHPDEKLFLERVLKEAVHELGHTFGLGHCKNPFCVMYFSNSIADTDRKGFEFCIRCSGKINASF